MLMGRLEILTILVLFSLHSGVIKRKHNEKLILVASIVSLSTWASETLQLKDGRYIQLNDDFTWQYVPQETQPSRQASWLLSCSLHR